jgi:plastocyanin
MIWRWVICFSLVALPAFPAIVTGKVELRDSRDPAVKKRLDYSGVVISLKPLNPLKPVARLGDAHAVMLQKDKSFIPHVLAISVGTNVEFPNQDPIFHSAFSSYSGQLFDLSLYAPGSSKSVRFTREGVVRAFCNIHSSMSAVIVVLATPYFALTAPSGSFEMLNVPPGDYQLSVFHERATPATLKNLERRVTVDQNGLTLPALAISEAGFLPMPHNNKYGHAYGPETDDHSIYPGVRK